MNFITICILFSSLSFYAYTAFFFKSNKMRDEFTRFGLDNIAVFIMVLQFLGATGLLIGFVFNPILILASAGLALLMFAGVLVRVKLRDKLWITFPALFYMTLNAYIFSVSLS